MKTIKSLSCCAALAVAAVLVQPQATEANVLVAPGSLAEQVTQAVDIPLVEVQRRVTRSAPRYRGRALTQRRAVRRGVPRAVPQQTYRYRYVPRRHGPRFRARQPGFHFYGGWWYAIPWWLGAPYYYHYYEAPRRTSRCDYWHQQCVRNWGYSNPNYRGCMRYHRCPSY